MRVFNQLLVTLISLGLIAGSALGIVYMVGFLTGTQALTQLVDDWFQSIAGLNTGQVQAILLGVFVLSLVLLVMELIPWRAQFIAVRDDSAGRTQLARADMERYLTQRLSKETVITPERVEVIVRDDRFEVAAGVVAPSDVDRREIQSRVEENIRSNLESIGLDEDLEGVEARVSRYKRVA